MEIQRSLHFIKVSTRPLRAQNMQDIMSSKPACDLLLEQAPQQHAHAQETRTAALQTELLPS